MQVREAVNKMVNILVQIESLNEDLKQVKEDAKEAGLNAPVLIAVAKATVAGKVEELADKSESTLKVIEASRS